MQAYIAGNRIVDACGRRKAINTILTAAHGDNSVGVIKECYAVDFFHSADVISDNGQIYALAVE